MNTTNMSNDLVKNDTWTCYLRCKGTHERINYDVCYSQVNRRGAFPYYPPLHESLSVVANSTLTLAIVLECAT
jgi:hypothetical protein